VVTTPIQDWIQDYTRHIVQPYTSCNYSRRRQTDADRKHRLSAAIVPTSDTKIFGTRHVDYTVTQCIGELSRGQRSKVSFVCSRCGSNTALIRTTTMSRAKRLQPLPSAIFSRICGSAPGTLFGGSRVYTRTL
jgi:hypothetical protein